MFCVELHLPTKFNTQVAHACLRPGKGGGGGISKENIIAFPGNTKGGGKAVKNLLGTFGGQ